jgi:hypothetical protein
MICQECSGDGFTYDNKHDMPRHSPSKGGTFQPTWTCWLCNGEGSIEEVEDDDM